jgi:single-stranded DNA-binding protein
MGQVRTTFDGGVVAEPETKTFDSGSRVLEYPVYVNRRRKNRDTGEYEDTGDVTKIRVQIWNDRIEEFETPSKGDIVEVTGSIFEREYQKNDGTTGRSLETDWVDAVEIKFRKQGASGGGGGFDSGGGF